MNEPSFDGLLVLDKPGGMTSRDVVDLAQRWFPRRTRIGHTGTLDPLATGVLVLCVGVATRLSEFVQDMGKTYRTRLLLGANSDTDDADGTVTHRSSVRVPTREEVLGQLAGFVGRIEQVPPRFSAAKVTGRRAYDLARKGEQVVLGPRVVMVYGIELLSYEYPRLELEVRCGKGTYIRSLARDLGEHLGCGALVEVLRRTRVGPFTEADAMALDVDRVTAQSRLLPIAAAVSGLPRLTVSPEEVARLRQGRDIPLTAAPSDKEIAVFAGDGTLVAVAAAAPAKGVLLPVKVLKSVTS